MGQMSVGRLFGIPIVLDASFLFLVVLFGFGYFTAGSVTSVSYGLLFVTGVALSILLHELSHASAAHFYGVPTSHIELNGLGGLCYYARPIGPDRLKNIVVLLAGPAANLILWKVCEAGSEALFQPFNNGIGAIRIGSLLGQLAQINEILFFFNLMPAHPLDGGRALVYLLSGVVGYDRAMWFIAILGMFVVLGLVWFAFMGQLYALVVAFVLFSANAEVLTTHGGGPRWRRRN